MNKNNIQRMLTGLSKFPPEARERSLISRLSIYHTVWLS